MEAELPAVLVVGQAKDGSGTTPEGLAAVSISLVLLEQLQVLHEHNPISKDEDIQLLQVGLLQYKPLVMQYQLPWKQAHGSNTQTNLARSQVNIL